MRFEPKNPYRSAPNALLKACGSDPLPECTSYLRTVMKLPFSRFLRNLLKNNKEINVGQIYQQCHPSISEESTFEEQNIFQERSTCQT
jgi:hypothetical protein